jgi:HAD superfamily hydrolase (TIGR01549 family)
MTMIKAVLLDLDDTLLRANTETFVREYLRILNEFFSRRWGTTRVSQTVVDSARHIMTNQPRDIELLNGEVMLEAFVQNTGKSAYELWAAFDEFHQNVHPLLKNCTEPIADAPELVQYLKEQGYAVVIATNPIYAADATNQRLAWAGLPNADAFTLVTHSGNMHFAKPDPAYYGEILARISVEPDEAVMVGDSLRNDIEAASQLGLNTYFVTIAGEAASVEKATGSGTLHDFYLQVTEGGWLETLQPRPLSPTIIEPELRGNIGALFGLLREVKPHYWEQQPAPDEWSIMQIVCHLLESERTVQRLRLQHILAEDNPFIVAPHTPSRPKEAVACERDGMKAARAFAQERQQTIEWLRNLEPNDWTRPARHSVFGPTTLLKMAHCTAQHDRLHLYQLCWTLGRCQ